MFIPADFKQAIADTFQDKDIERVGETIITENDGSERKEIGAVTGSFKGNVQLKNFKKVQEMYGLDYVIDIAVTCSTDIFVEVDEAIQYNSIMYRVTDVLPFDSHKLIVGALWATK